MSNAITDVILVDCSVAQHQAVAIKVGAGISTEASYDAVEVEGDPPIDLRVRGGIFGDTATVGMLVNTAPIAAGARPGLQTMADLPVPRASVTTPQWSRVSLTSNPTSLSGSTSNR